MKDAINWEKLRSLANIPRHSVDIRIDVDDCLLTWPSRKRRLSWGRDGHFGNVEYIPLDSDVDWSTAQEYLELELHVIERTAEQCGSPDDFMRVMEAVREEFGDEIDPPEVSDTGINGVVFALAAFGCAPLTSCAGHLGAVPHVVFWTKKKLLPTLIEASHHSSTGLINNEDGTVELYGASLVDLQMFASKLVEQSLSTSD